MRISTTSAWLLCWLTMAVASVHADTTRGKIPSSFGRPRSSLSILANTVPRGGGLDPKQAVVTVGLSYLGAHAALDIVNPTKVVELYGLQDDDTSHSSSMNAFYFTQIGSAAFMGVVFLALQLYWGRSFREAFGAASITHSLVPTYQLLTKTYEEAGVNRNNGILMVFASWVNAAVALGPSDWKFAPMWLNVMTFLSGLGGLNLVVSAQTIPSLRPTTVAIVRILGSVTSYVAVAMLSQGLYGASPIQAFGYLLVALGVLSIPVVGDLQKVGSNADLSMRLYLLYIVLEFGVAEYLLR